MDLKVKIMKADRLTKLGIALNPYCVVRLGNTEQKTAPKRGKKPEWNQEFVFPMENQDAFHLDLWDKGIVSSNELLGSAKVSLKTNQNEEFWIPLYSPDGNYEGKLQIEWKLVSSTEPRKSQEPKRVSPIPKLFESHEVLNSTDASNSNNSKRNSFYQQYDQPIVNDGTSQFLQASRQERHSVGSLCNPRLQSSILNGTQGNETRSSISLEMNTPYLRHDSGTKSSVSLGANTPAISTDVLSKYSSLQRGSSSKFLTPTMEHHQYSSPIIASNPSITLAPPLPPRSRNSSNQSSDNVSKYSSLNNLGSISNIGSHQSIAPKEPGSPKRVHNNENATSPKRQQYVIGSNEYLQAMNQYPSDIPPSRVGQTFESTVQYQSYTNYSQADSTSYSNQSQRYPISTGPVGNTSQPGYNISPNDSISTVGHRAHSQQTYQEAPLYINQNAAQYHPIYPQQDRFDQYQNLQNQQYQYYQNVNRIPSYPQRAPPLPPKDADLDFAPINSPENSGNTRKSKSKRWPPF